jgi:phosphatidylinositol alpha-1,6-mannosyltransferase
MSEQIETSKKILCITNDFGPRAGGIETFIIGLIERLPKGSVIVYTSSQENSEPFDRAWNENFDVEVIRDRSKILLPTLRVSGRVQSMVKEREIATVFFGAAAPLGLLARGARRAGAKNIVAITHGHEVWWSKLWPFSWAIKHIGKNVDSLTYLGGYTGKAISKALSKSSQSKLVRLAPGIDTDHFSPGKKNPGIRRDLGLEGKKVIVSVGRLVHRKGQDFLIDALPIIALKIPSVHLLLVGEGPYRAELEKRSETLGVRDRITFIGRVQYAELPEYICVGDIFAMPSRSRLAGLEVEGLGIVYLEASSCGLPVIGGFSGGAPDAVLEGETGFSVDGTSAIAIAEAAILLLGNPEYAAKLGAQGRDWIVKEWRWEIWSEQFKKLVLR